MAENENRPLIIKRKKVIVGGGHHGGAWKVAIHVPFLASVMAQVRRPSHPGPVKAPRSVVLTTATRVAGSRHPSRCIATLALNIEQAPNGQNGLPRILRCRPIGSSARQHCAAARRTAAPPRRVIRR